MSKREMKVWSLDEASRRAEEQTQHGGSVFFFGAEEVESQLFAHLDEIMAQIVENIAEVDMKRVRLPSRLAVYLRRGGGAPASDEFGFEAVPASEAFMELRRALAAAVDHYAESIDDPSMDYNAVDSMLGDMVRRFAGEVREAYIFDPPQVAWVRLVEEDWTPALEDWFGGRDALPVVWLYNPAEQG